MILKKIIPFVLIAAFVLSSVGNLSAKLKKNEQPIIPAGIAEREFLINTLIKIANPVLEALSKNQLKEKMPVESAPNQVADRKNYT